MRLGTHKSQEQELGKSYFDAKTRRLKFYTGKPCIKCGSSTRRTSRKGCYPCEVVARRGAWARQASKNPARMMLHSAKSRAKRDHLPFDITVADIEAVWPKDNHCPIFPEIVLTQGLGLGEGPKPESPTLDKFIPSKGYVKGNIAVVSFRANRIRQSETDPKVFHRIAAWMENFYGIK